MMKKMFLAALFGALAMVSVSAQNQVDNFLGTWKLSRIEGAPKNSTVKSIVLNISQTGAVINVERNTLGIYNNQNYSKTDPGSFDLSGASSVNIIGGKFGGTVRNEVRFLADDKLRFDSILERDNSTVSARELWTVSGDGKTLTVESTSRTRYNTSPENSGGVVSTKMIFTKQ